MTIFPLPSVTPSSPVDSAWHGLKAADTGLPGDRPPRAEPGRPTAPVSPRTLTYRREIDGLRAIAVLSIVLFHAFPTSITGGFTGVDVFFVISGFLISGTIFSALDQGSFTFTAFYARRVRRIFPALIVTLLACLIFGWSGCSRRVPRARQARGDGAAFFSNINLWQETGYFDRGAESKPLLHLWSLGVEEQFYAIWPIFVVLIKRWTSSPGILLLTICVASFITHLALSVRDPAAAFYLPITRVWELGAGGALAYMDLYKGGLVGNVLNILSGRGRAHPGALAAPARQLSCMGRHFLGPGRHVVERQGYGP